jgi:putative ABC transport system permease protein
MIKDLRYAVRTLLKRPGFLLVALATLSLGIGGTTAMFTIVNSVLLRPLQFREPERLVFMDGLNPHLGITDGSTSIPDVVEWQQQAQSFEQLAGFFTWGALVTTGDETERVRAADVSPEFFPLLGTAPVSGRTFAPADAQADSEPVTVISYGLWQRHYGGAADVVGRKIPLSGSMFTVVGIMPAGFSYPGDAELWTVLPLDVKGQARDNRFLRVIGRLKPGVSIAQAQAELDTISQRLGQSYGETNSGWGVHLTGLHDRLVGELRPALYMLFGAVAFVLLIACANVANLLLARAAYRQKEIAVRTALGASRWRVVKQLLSESLLLSVVSGVIGLVLSVWLVKLLIAISPPNSPRFNEITINWQVFAFAFGLTILAGLLFGLVPALQTSRTDLNETLKESGRTGAPGASRNRIGGLLIVSEVALSFVLLAGAGLLIKSFMHLREVNPGFAADNVLAVRMTLPPGKYKQGEPRSQIFHQLVDNVKTVPGVQDAGAILSLPLSGDTFNLGRGVLLEGRPAVAEEATSAAHLTVTPSYFRTLNIPLKEGRLFTDHDNAESPKVVIVNETMARKLWPGESPVGRRFSIWRDEKFSREVVGVVGDTKMSLDKEVEQQMYVPYAQDAVWGSMSLVVRTNGAPAAVAGAVRQAIKSVDQGVATYNLKTLNDVVSVSAAPRRVPMLLLSAFAGIAMLLAMIGIYGITSYYVTQRTREIGVRMALGAQIADVLKLVLRRAMVLAVIGVAVGVAGAFVMTRYLEALLFGVKPIDVITFVAVAVGLIVVALVACLIPARRAAKVDPLIALRYE